MPLLTVSRYSMKTFNIEELILANFCYLELCKAGEKCKGMFFSIPLASIVAFNHINTV